MHAANNSRKPGPNNSSMGGNGKFTSKIVLGDIIASGQAARTRHNCKETIDISWCSFCIMACMEVCNVFHKVQHRTAALCAAVL